MENADNPSTQKPDWLRDIQNNSWNPELIISGISLVFIFTISDEITEYAVKMTQETATNPLLIMVGTMYSSIAVVALKWTFSIHLMLRGIWVGMVGLSYVFPKGINFERLPKMQRAKYVLNVYDQPVDMILLLERMCSSIFSLAFAAVGISLFILLFIFIAYALNMLGLSIWISLGIVFFFMTLVSVIVPINYIYYRLSGGKYITILIVIYQAFMRVTKYLFYKDSLLVFQTNVNRYIAIIGFGLFFMFLGMQTGTFLQPTMNYFSVLTPERTFIPSGEPSTPGQEINVIEPREYLDRSERRVQRAQINSFNQSEDPIEVFIAEYLWDEKAYASVGDDSVQTRSIDQLVTLSINDSVYQNLSWYRTTHQHTGQAGWMTFIPLDTTIHGMNTLQIDKRSWHYQKETVVPYEAWAVIPFTAYR